MIQVPAGPELFGTTDEAAGHVRRFDAQGLREVIQIAGLEPIQVTGFNKLGAIGWRLHHAFRAGRITASEAKAFDLMVPIAKRLEPLLLGESLSLLAVARVP